MVFFSSWFVWDSLFPKLPEKDSPPKLYSNQCQQDLFTTLLNALSRAESSIHLVMFGLSDSGILKALKEKIAQDVKTTVYYDVGGSPKIYEYLKGSDIHPITSKGLMHQKILVIDHEMVFIGSANMTKSSLKMHDNLVIGFSHKAVAKFLESHKPYTPGHFQAQVGGQLIKLWLLPDPRGNALKELRKQIRNAKKSIRIALFTFTHQGLIDEVIDAHQRGVDVRLVIDQHSAVGASRKAVEILKKKGVPISLSTKEKLLHHKFAYIDQRCLITGSANWTKSALYKNSDCIISIHEMNQEQVQFMDKLWKSIDL